MKTSSLAVSAASLFALAGIAPAADFTFSPVCGNYWIQECGNGQPCPSGGWQTFNNWGQTGCAGGLPTPGAPDLAHLLGNTVVINQSVSVLGIDETAAANVEWQGGDLTIAAPFANIGSFTISGGNKTLSASIDNQGTFIQATDYVTVFNNAQILNAGTAILQTANWTHAAGADGLFTNNAVTVKAGGAVADLWIPFVNNGSIDIQQGSLRLRSTTLTSNTGSTCAIAPGASLLLESMTLDGKLTATNQGTLLAYGSLNFRSPTTLNVTGNGFEWQGGDLHADGKLLTNAGIFYITGGNRTLTGGIVNDGVMVETSDYLRAFSNAWLLNNGTLELRTAAWAPAAGAEGELTNVGALVKTTAASAILTLHTVNHGQVSVEAGSLTLRNLALDSSAGSSYIIANGASLVLDNVTLSGLVDVDNSGSMLIANGLTLATPSTLDVTGNGVTYQGGNLDAGAGPLVNAGLLTLTGGNRTIFGEIDNLGTIVETSDYLRAFSDAQLVNSGAIELRTAFWAPAAGKSGLFTNTGTLRKTTGAGAEIQLATSNDGPWTIEAGTLRLRAATIDSTPHASYTVSPGAVFILDGLTVEGTIQGTNSGTVQLPHGITLKGPATLAFSGNGLEWQGGDINTGDDTLTNAGLITNTGGNRSIFGAVNNEGTIIETSDYLRAFNGAHLTNHGVIELRTASWGAAGTSPAIANPGAIYKTTPAAATVSVPTTNSGLIDVQAGFINFSGGLTQTAGITRLSGGAAQSTQVTLNGGRLEGLGTAFAPVGNVAGVVAPDVSAGALTLQGTYTQSSGGSLELRLAGDSLSGHLAITGDASLAGTLIVSFVGGYTPAPGTTFRFLDVTGARTGMFNPITYQDRPYTLAAQVSYDAHGATLTIVHRCGSPDFDGDGNIGTDADIAAFFSCLGGACCPTCDSVDFNYDHDLGTDQDIEAFFRVLAGGNC